MVEEIKCNCTSCGSRYRVKLDRIGNGRKEPAYCTLCRAMLEDAS